MAGEDSGDDGARPARALIWRTVRAVCIVLVVLMALTLALEYRGGAREPAGAAQLLADYYATRSLESSWEVRGVEAEPGGVVVHLVIPRGASGSFQRIPAGAQFQAFGAVCPPPDHEVWGRMRPDEDVYIHSAGSTGESIMRRLSCRHWNGV